MIRLIAGGLSKPTEPKPPSMPGVKGSSSGVQAAQHRVESVVAERHCSRRLSDAPFQWAAFTERTTGAGLP